MNKLNTISKGYITRAYAMDAGHRVMHERVKCWNLHGHRYTVEMTFSYDELHSIGYAIDFKEIKRVACTYFDKRFDHGFFANPKDEVVIEAMKQVGNIHGETSKIHLMNLQGEGQFCNPSAENIAKEIFFAAHKLIDDPQDCNLAIHRIRLYETPNCWVDCYAGSLSESDWYHLNNSSFARDLEEYRKEKGSLEYDERKASKKDLKTKDLEN